MDIILLNASHAAPRNLRLTPVRCCLLLLLLLFLPIALGVGSYWLSYQWQQPAYSGAVATQWQQQLQQDRQALAKVERQADNRLHALTLRFAEMQAQLVRLDALGERLVEVAGIESSEFNFTEVPALGGPEAGNGEGLAYRPPSFAEAIRELETTLMVREQQLNIINSLLLDRHLEKTAELAGWPVEDGWISSRYGYRTDPFSGKLHRHEGIDFAGDEGEPIRATATGVVTWAGKRSGYGNLVAINHGNGLSTRYGHCKKLLVKPGDIVKAGEVIALMGSTGRSTGPHVHYEVRKNGRPVNPVPYLARR